MGRPARRSAVAVIALTAIAASSVAMASAATASTRKWTKISTNTGLGIASAGLLRTTDGKLHVVWPRNDGAHGYSRKAVTAPRSSTGTASHVAIAAAPGGHLWILWYDTGLNKIRVVRTNAAGTRFGAVLTISGPPKVGEFDGLQALGSKGPLDVLTLLQQNVKNATPSYWDTQLLPALKLTSSRSSVSHQHSTTITFTVTDVGDPVAGAKVRFLGTTVTANVEGVARITVRKGTPTGKHTASASKASYTTASFKVKVT